MQSGEMIMKQNKETFDFKAFGLAIKMANTGKTSDLTQEARYQT